MLRFAAQNRGAWVASGRRSYPAPRVHLNLMGRGGNIAGLMPKPTTPVQFGRYQLLKRIALGGMAEIFLAKIQGAMGFEKPVVIKRILPQYADDADFLKMFITEAKLVCHLEHPNIVQVLELDEIEGQYYIAMEYVNGVDAKEIWRTLGKRRQRLPGVLAVFVVSEFLKGLDYAHRAVGASGELLGVVHRDVSPSNILISYRGDVKISDFGIALVEQESKTQMGVLKGKYGYMSPEQISGIRVDHRSDLFAAGIVLAELLLGRRLFLGRNDFETLDKALNVKLDILEENAPAHPPELVQIVRRALAREPDARFQSAREFHDAIVEYLYQNQLRVTQETVAAFIAEHVVPHLRPATKVADGSTARAPIHGTPFVAGSVIPGDSELKLQTARHRETAERAGVLIDGRDAAAPARDPAGRPVTVEGHPLLTPTVSNRVVATGGLAAVESGEEALQLVLDPSMLSPEREAASYSFGAIPIIDLEAGGGDIELGMSLEELQAQAIKRAGHRTETLAPVGTDPHGDLGPGEEFDLAFEDDAALAQFPINEPSGQVPSPLLNAVDRGEAERGEADRPDFSGRLAVRTVAKVLFRFAVAGENGLLALSTTRPRNPGSGNLAWLGTLESRLGVSWEPMGGVGRSCEIHFVDGQPHLASANRSEKALVAYLLESGILAREAVERALRANPHRRLMAALVSDGLIVPLRVVRHVAACVLDNVIDAFSWSEGTFSFYRGRECSREAFPTGLDSLELISRGVASLPSEVLDRFFEGHAGRQLSRNPSPPLRIEHFSTNPLVTQTYLSLGAPASVEGALSSLGWLGDPIRAKQSLYLLIECELVTLL
jgi:eukaryotic-like serine/threonine-protein kinase